ncbi:MAG: NAD(P)-binding domain-containing protein, partial [Deltaproteobacteria bacterium]|nr:NAD(P)-binding domain-containing protein [Deltaproteobacteria bacterium]
MEYAFIGGGNMGWAMASALIGKGVCPPGEILVVEPEEANR